MRLSTISIISASIITGLIAGIFIYQLQPPAPTNNSTAEITLDIPEKSSFAEIVKLLSQKGLIRSERLFKIYSLITGKAHRLKPGKYFFPINDLSRLSTPKLAEILVSGPKEISAVIYPGMTLKEIDERLSSLAIIKSGDLMNFDAGSLKNDYPRLPLFKNNLEGFLFPDTYHFFPATSPDLTIRKILDNFKLKVLPFFNGNANLLNTLILASLLEKEIPDGDEQRIAAGILKKRMSVGMPLQIDATVIYAKCEGRFLKCAPLNKKDYEIDSLYNTYLYPGLPPAPISNPSLKTVKATMEPVKTDYWYYLSDPKTKKTIFSETLDKHNKNRVKYLNK